MPIDTPHPEYALRVATWQRIKDCLDGSDTVHAARERYLPRLSKQSDEDYAKYNSAANFFNGTARTHEAVLGFIFRKPPTEEKVDSLKNAMNDVDLTGSPMGAYARQVVYAAASTGRAGTLVDWSSEEGRPYLAFYPENSIVNWAEARIGGRCMLTMLILKESTLEAGMDGFKQEVVVRYREIRLIEDVVVVQMWKGAATSAAAPGRVSGAAGTGSNGESAGVERQGDPLFLMRRGEPLTEIPFVFHGSETTGVCVDKPPLADISAVNISHYRTSADLENGRHICGIPTAYAVGFDAEEKLYLGPNYAWTTDNIGATCGFLEFTGQGLSALEKGLQEKQDQMAALGARLIETQKADAEAYDTVQLRASAETSTLHRLTMLTSESLSEVLQIMAWWIGTEKDRNAEIRYSLNTDFASAGIKPEMLTALTSAYQQSIISRETLFYQLLRGEMYVPGRTLEEEKASIEADPPMPVMPPPIIGNPGPPGNPGNAK